LAYVYLCLNHGGSDQGSDGPSLSGSDWDVTDAEDPDEPLPTISIIGGPTETVHYFHHEHVNWKLCTQTTAYAGRGPAKEAVGFHCHIHGCRPGLRLKRSGRVPTQAQIQHWLRDGLQEANTPIGKAKHMSQFNVLLVDA
jgi:hypothetical protein